MQMVNGAGLPPPAGIAGSLSLAPNPNAVSAANPQAAGQAFEGMFASVLLKQMRQSLGNNTLFGQDKSDALGGLFDHFLGQHMASHGGLGISAMIRKQLELRSPSNVQQQQQQPQRLPAAYAGAALPLQRPPAARSYGPRASSVAGARHGSSLPATQQ